MSASPPSPTAPAPEPQEGAGEALEFRVTLAGDRRTWSVTAQSTETVGALLDRVSRKVELPPEDVRVIYRQRIISSCPRDQTLAAAGILETGATLSVVRRLRVAAQPSEPRASSAGRGRRAVPRAARSSSASGAGEASRNAEGLPDTTGMVYYGGPLSLFATSFPLGFPNASQGGPRATAHLFRLFNESPQGTAQPAPSVRPRVSSHRMPARPAAQQFQERELDPLQRILQMMELNAAGTPSVASSGVASGSASGPAPETVSGAPPGALPHTPSEMPFIHAPRILSGVSQDASPDLPPDWGLASFFVPRAGESAVGGTPGGAAGESEGQHAQGVPAGSAGPPGPSGLAGSNAQPAAPGDAASPVPSPGPSASPGSSQPSPFVEFPADSIARSILRMFGAGGDITSVTLHLEPGAVSSDDLSAASPSANGSAGRGGRDGHDGHPSSASSVSGVPHAPYTSPPSSSLPSAPPTPANSSVAPTATSVSADANGSRPGRMARARDAPFRESILRAMHVPLARTAGSEPAAAAGQRPMRRFSRVPPVGPEPVSHEAPAQREGRAASVPEAAGAAVRDRGDRHDRRDYRDRRGALDAAAAASGSPETQFPASSARADSPAALPARPGASPPDPWIYVPYPGAGGDDSDQSDFSVDAPAEAFRSSPRSARASRRRAGQCPGVSYPQRFPPWMPSWLPLWMRRRLHRDIVDLDAIRMLREAGNTSVSRGAVSRLRRGSRYNRVILDHLSGHGADSQAGHLAAQSVGGMEVVGAVGSAGAAGAASAAAVNLLGVSGCSRADPVGSPGASDAPGISRAAPDASVPCSAEIVRTALSAANQALAVAQHAVATAIEASTVATASGALSPGRAEALSQHLLAISQISAEAAARAQELASLNSAGSLDAQADQKRTLFAIQLMRLSNELNDAFSGPAGIASEVSSFLPPWLSGAGVSNSFGAEDVADAVDAVGAADVGVDAGVSVSVNVNVSADADRESQAEHAVSRAPGEQPEGGSPATGERTGLIRGVLSQLLDSRRGIESTPAACAAGAGLPGQQAAGGLLGPRESGRLREPGQGCQGGEGGGSGPLALSRTADALSPLGALASQRAPAAPSLGGAPQTILDIFHEIFREPLAPGPPGARQGLPAQNPSGQELAAQEEHLPREDAPRRAG